MSLTLVPTPIGNKDDFSIRALNTLRNADVIILEEFKESSQWLRLHGISGKPMEQLNEHSKADDLQRLAQICQDKTVALITDCGTPGFADPGAHLIAECRKKNIVVQALPGPSSLMTLLSLSSRRLDEFVFRGFLPAETESRKKAWSQMLKEPRAFVLMDTPYRMGKMVDELTENLGDRRLLFVANLTQDDEFVFDGKASKLKIALADNFQSKKAEFMVLVYGN
jgi:16S rRNA (cytidine1402-2'-O)-methyltransferase